MHIEKSPLSKKMSHVLKSSVLEQALSQAGIQLEVSLVHDAGAGCLFRGFFWPPHPNVPHERLYVQAGAVPNAWSQMAREYIEASVVPHFVTWVQNILALPVDSPVRRERQCFSPALPAHLSDLSLNQPRLRRSS
jgi:hypothetical protein